LEVTRLRCVIRFPFRNRGQGQTDRRGQHQPSLDQGWTQVIFRVRGVISPLLANVYLHYVFDLWVEVWREKIAQGDMVVVRYADDLVAGFQQRADAERFLRDFQERLAKFGLEVHPEKTRLIEFGRFAASDRRKRGQGKPETFTFLGFTHFCGTNSRGQFVVWRHTAAKRMRAKLRVIQQELRRMMHEPVAVVGAWLKRVVEGCYRYHAVPGNLYGFPLRLMLISALCCFRVSV
jgi:hypothetical protein